MIFILRVFFYFLIVNQAIAYAGKNPNLAYTLISTPDWVKTVNYNTSAKNTQQQALNYILMDDQVNTLKQLQRYRHRVISPLTTIGLEQVSELKLSFNPAFEQLLIHKILVKRDSQIRDLTHTAKVRVIHREEQLFEGIQDGQATAIIILDDIRIGDIIDYSYSVNGSNPIFSNQRFGYLPLDASLEIGTVSIRLLVDNKKQTQVHLFNNSTVKINKISNGNIDEYSIFRQGVAAINPEEATPAWYAHYGWLEYSEYASWADVDRWGQALYNTPIESTYLFESTYQQLAKNSTDKADFIANALFFVQNEIRYLGLEFGENSHKPRPPTEVLQKRYGDCKDKAWLLSKLLQRHGVIALPALVSTQFRKGIVNELPSPGVFNHVITYVSFNDKVYWLDATRRYQAGHLDAIGTEDFGVALVIGHPSKKLLTMYEQKPIETSIDVEENFYITDFKGAVEYQIITTSHGNTAESQREYFSNNSASEIGKSYANFYSHFHEDLNIIKPLEYIDDTKKNRFIVKEYYQLNNFWKETTKNQKSIISTPIILTAFSNQLFVPKSMLRTTPLALPTPKIINSRLYLHLPTDVKLDFDGKVLSIENDAISFHSLDRYYNKTYYNHSELTIKKSYIEANDFKDFSKDFRNLKDLWEYTISLPSPESNSYYDIIKLKNKLKSNN